MEENKSNIEDIEIDALLETPITFKLNGRFFYVYQPSIGVSMLSKRILERLGVNETIKTINPTLAIISCVQEHKNDILRYIAIHTFVDRKKALDENAVNERVNELATLGVEELTSLFVSITSWGSWVTDIEKNNQIDKERETREKVSAVKNEDKSSVTFGGRSIWGRLIDFSCERYGWSVEYVLWGVSATNLSLMMADSISCVYLTDKERSKVHIPTDGLYIKADTKKGIQQLRKHLKDL